MRNLAEWGQAGRGRGQAEREQAGVLSKYFRCGFEYAGGIFAEYVKMVPILNSNSSSYEL